jgi:ribose/xylose/arabinose/galactoside ABC-type transport system permease subunit
MESTVQTRDLPVHRARGRYSRRLFGNRNFAITLVGFVLFTGFALGVDHFLTADNVLNMVRQVALTAIAAVGMTFLFIAGEFDLSIGSVYGFLTVVMGLVVVRYGWNPWVGAGAVMLLGCGIGALNGLLVTKVGLPAFVVTLAGMTAYRSGALLISGEQPFAAAKEGLFYAVTGGDVARIVPSLIIWMLLVVTLGGTILAKTRFGAHAYATGGDLHAARSAGIDTDHVKLICFVLTSGLCGLIASLLFGWLHVAAPSTGIGFEFRVIGALILGGVSLIGGRGSIYGSVVGALILSMLGSGLVLLGFSQHWVNLATGVTILFSATLDMCIRQLAHPRPLHLEES